MTVKELIEELQKANPNEEVLIDCDYCESCDEPIDEVAVYTTGKVVIRS